MAGRMSREIRNAGRQAICDAFIDWMLGADDAQLTALYIILFGFKAPYSPSAIGQAKNLRELLHFPPKKAS